VEIARRACEAAWRRPKPDFDLQLPTFDAAPDVAERVLARMSAATGDGHDALVSPQGELIEAVQS
jgi:hypothetical protein